MAPAALGVPLVVPGTCLFSCSCAYDIFNQFYIIKHIIDIKQFYVINKVYNLL